MGYGTSLGTAHEDEMSYVLEKGMTDKQLADRSEINLNSRSGDFQSRFSASDASTMPLEASRKLTDALKQTGGSQTPEKVPETNFIDKLLGTGGAERYQLWPERLARSAFTLPGDVLSGKVEPGSTQEIERAADLAGLVVLGPAPVAAKLADGSLGSFAGVKSRTLPKDKLYEAQNMELDAMHPDDIWTKTGFFRGADNRWRYEIPDKDAKLKMESFDVILDPLAKPNKNMEATGGGWTNVGSGTPQGDKIVPKTLPRKAEALGDLLFPAVKQPLTLDKVLDHPELFKAYPELKTMKVEPLPEYAIKRGNKGMVIGDTIYLAPGHPEYVRSVLMHEIQHGIQHHEGFAFGGQSEQFLPKELPQAIKEFESARSKVETEITENIDVAPKVVKDWKSFIEREQSNTLDEVSHARLLNFKVSYPDVYKKLSNIVKSERLIQQAREEAFTKYTRLMGEVEARNVQARQSMTDFMSESLPPNRTEDTPRHLQINPKFGDGISFDDGINDSSYVSGGASHYKDFRRSDNVEDRRAEGILSKLSAFVQGVSRLPSAAEFKEMLKHPMTKYIPPEDRIPVSNILSKQIGTDDLDRHLK